MMMTWLTMYFISPISGAKNCLTKGPVKFLIVYTYALDTYFSLTWDDVSGQAHFAMPGNHPQDAHICVGSTVS